MLDLLVKMLGDPNVKKVKKVQPIVDHINKLEPEYAALSDEELRAKTDYFRQHLAERPVSEDYKKDRELEKKALDEILPDAFATVREAGKRVLNMRHFDVQLIGGIYLHEGHIAEMRTGEGKTLVATLPAYLNALTGKGVHIITVNDYLAKRDSEWMGKIFNFLGLSVGVVLSNRDEFNFEGKKAAYNCDITYGTNNEFGFDYLRDNMAASMEQRVQRRFNYAIIDEVDSILIDEARTPLIISGRLEKSAELYKTMAKIAPQLKKVVDYEVDEKNKNIILTEEGIDRAQELLGVNDLFDINNQWAHHLLQALKAKELFILNTDYVIKNGEVVIVDEFTGRLMEGRRWSEGLHQAIEAKENVKIQDETQTLASITFQNLFRLYPKLSGMTGTAMTEEAEFGKIYNLEVTSIPTNKKDIRIDYPDVIYKTEKQKFLSVVDEIIAMHKIGRPVLVGTISIEKSEILSGLLKQRGIPHNILNAKHHEKEAYIIAQAGRLGAVTIATNMAGRGTDILLGGNAEYLAKEKLLEKNITPETTKDYETIKNNVLAEAVKTTLEEHNKVVELGGLHVIGTERHESRRIDNQLRGRAARQGDPGSTRFFLSLQDDLMRIFGGEKVALLMDRLGVDETMAIENPIITSQIASSQKKVETFHFDARKSIIEYDDVMNLQREKFYAQRLKVLEGGDLRSDIIFMIEKEVERVMNSYIAPGMNPDEYIQEDLASMIREIHSVMPQLSALELKDVVGMKYENMYDKIKDMALDAYKNHEKQMVDFYNNVLSQYEPSFQAEVPYTDKNIMRQLERDILLRVVDNKWIDHLNNIDMLRDGIGLRAYGQKNPLLEYKKEAYELFNKMMFEIQSETVQHLFRTKFGVQVVEPQGNSMNYKSPLERNENNI
ncbi:preprotein translocase subunit SecA [bacterium]|nr:preprotein translocase subunit SecA [bacterium]